MANLADFHAAWLVLLHYVLHLLRKNIKIKIYYCISNHFPSTMPMGFTSDTFLAQAPPKRNHDSGQ
jgi:hypothetical protein